MTLRPSEIVLIRMRFHQAPGSKVRPAVVLLDTEDDDFVAAPITSQSRVTQWDLPIHGWHSAGLNVPSTARIHKLAVLPKTDVVRTLGAMDQADSEALADLLCQAFCNRAG